MTAQSIRFAYLISYTAPLNGGQTFGSVEYFTETPIQSMADVRAITRELAVSYGLTNPLVLGFSPFIRIPAEHS